MVRTTFQQPNQQSEQVALARKMFVAGCFALPWLWIVNVWYFYPIVFGGGGPAAATRNPELTKWVRRSMVGAVSGVSVFLLWVLVFQMNWQRWGRPAVDFMIYAPSTYTTGW